MFKILNKRKLAENAVEFEIEAPSVTVNAEPGQFIILRVDEEGERVPLTICGIDKAKGSVVILVQSVGYTTQKLCGMETGAYIADFVGPLGLPTELGQGKALLIGGGIGTAVIYPQAKLLKSQNRVADVILGARNKSLIVYEDELRAAAEKLYVTTDDGTRGEKGFVTDVLKRLLDGDKNAYGVVFAVGPMPMMRAVCGVTKAYGIKTIVSMNAVMVDGTGMCGCCRVTLGGETKYACVDGPDFDGGLIDWDEAVNRLKNFAEIEKEHMCRLHGL